MVAVKDYATDILREMSCIERLLDRQPKRVIVSETIARELGTSTGPLWPKKRGLLFGVPLYVRPDFEVK